MSRPAHSLPPEYFETKYAQKLDYWDFETSPYEAAKYAHTLRALPRAHYPRGLEIGCSIGVLTARLAERCGELLSVDVSERALAAAQARCRSCGHVRLERRQFPREWPVGEKFDLLVVSEVGYYWSREELSLARERLAEGAEAGAHLVLVHWTSPETDYPLTGDEVHEAFLADPRWRPIRAEREEKYRLEVLERQGEPIAS